jgi:hypothetical protein
LFVASSVLHVARSAALAFVSAAAFGSREPASSVAAFVGRGAGQGTSDDARGAALALTLANTLAVAVAVAGVFALAIGVGGGGPLDSRAGGCVVSQPRATTEAAIIHPCRTC